MKEILYKNQVQIDLILNGQDFITKFKLYCAQDCLTFWHIIVRFNYLIFENFNLNIHSFPTLPSLAFSIFSAQFLN
jgi:hypothetical protein